MFRWVALVVLLAAFAFAQAVSSQLSWGGDFEATTYEPARAVLAGDTPYPPIVNANRTSAYPPAVFIAATPIAVLPRPVAIAVWQSVLLFSAFLTLWLLEVRDPRCYALWLLSSPVVFGLIFGSATLLLILGCATAWRFRRKAVPCGLALGAAIAIKLFVAPLMLWLVFARRWAAAAVACTSGTAIVFGSWTIIGFDGLLDYPDRLRDLSAIVSRDGLFVQALVHQLGASGNAASLTGVTVACACFAIAFRRDETTSFALLALGSLALTPIAWIDYLGILIVPLAARYPRFHPTWLLLALLWVRWGYSPLERSSWELSAALVATCVLLVVLLSRALPIAARGRTRLGIDPS